MKKNLKFIFLTIIFFGIFGLAKSSLAATIFQDDFEYGQDSSGRVQTFALPSWKWDAYNDWAGIFGVSSIHAHAGARSFLLNFLPYTNNSQTDLHIEKDANFGTDIWMQEWIYPAYEAGRYSRFDEWNKWIYAWMTSGNWCLGIGPTRFTGTDNWDQVAPLPDDHSGLFISFAGDGCATSMSGQNLSGHYIPMNRWSRLIVHVNTATGASPNEEAWIEDENGNITKVASHTSSLFTTGNPTNRIKLGTTFPGYGQSHNYLDSWMFVDGVVIANSSGDMDWTTGTDTTPPASPTGLSVQ
jgi:hypothetical protein